MLIVIPYYVAVRLKLHHSLLPLLALQKLHGHLFVSGS